MSEGSQLRDEGLDRVEASAAEWLRAARIEAERVFYEKGEVHIDDIREWASNIGYMPPTKYTWGAVFRRGWRKAGQRASRFKSNHSHISPVWQKDE